MISGIFACTSGAKDGDCLTSKPSSGPNVTTTMTVYNRRSTAVCAASNNSILSISDLGIPQQDLAINMTGLRLAMGWLLNYTASGLPIESSLNFWFWFAPSGAYDLVWKANAYTALKSTLSFIIWEFCTNNNENPNVAREQAGGQPVLPETFRTTASLCEPYTRFVLNRAAFISYLVLESLALGFGWAVLVWRLVAGDPDLVISSFSLVDFASKLGQKTTQDDLQPLVLRHLIRPESDDKVLMQSLAGVEVAVVHHSGLVTQPGPASLESAPSDSGHTSQRDGTEQLGTTQEADRNLLQKQTQELPPGNTPPQAQCVTDDDVSVTSQDTPSSPNVPSLNSRDSRDGFRPAPTQPRSAGVA